jgi:hypothetical protein
MPGIGKIKVSLDKKVRKTPPQQKKAEYRGMTLSSQLL